MRLSQTQAHAYWRQPDDGGNNPGAYLDYKGDGRKANMRRIRSEALVDLVRAHASDNASILEIGCNAGRNLKFLSDAGFSDLTAIEISSAAIDTMGRELPEVLAASKIVVGAVEDILPTLPIFDVVLTMATLVHIAHESEGVFEDMAKRVRQCLIVVEFEDEHDHARMFPRRYKPIFEALGLKQAVQIHPFPGMISGYVGRVFTP